MNLRNRVIERFKELKPLYVEKANRIKTNCKHIKFIIEIDGVFDFLIYNTETKKFEALEIWVSEDKNPIRHELQPPFTCLCDMDKMKTKKIKIPENIA